MKSGSQNLLEPSGPRRAIYGTPLPFTYLLNHSLTPWTRVLLENLTGFQLVKKFPAFYGTQRFVTIFTSACHLSPKYQSRSEAFCMNIS